MKAIYFEDENYYEVTLPKGNYIINGDALSIEKPIRLNKIDDVRKITETQVISHYTSINNVVTVEDFETEKARLQSKGEHYGYDYTFSNLDDEYNYKKFIKSITPLYVTKQVISEPLIIPIAITTVLDTGNPYITHRTYNSKLSDGFIYNRHSACINICKEKFASLGVSFDSSITSYQQTNNKKVWSYSSSGLRYAIAFGTYFLNNSWDVNNKFGKLDTLKDAYESDKEKLEYIIQSKYDIHFGELTLDKIKLQNLQNSLEQLLRQIRNIDYKKSGYASWSVAVKTASNSLKVIPTLFKSD